MHCFVMVNGDFSYLPEGHPRLLVSERAAGATVATRRSSSVQHPFFGSRILDRHVEVLPSTETHYDKSSASLAMLDRFYVAGPSWRLLQLNHSCRPIGDPVVLRSMGISDHAPTALVVSRRFPPAPGQSAGAAVCLQAP